MVQLSTLSDVFNIKPVFNIPSEIASQQNCDNWDCMTLIWLNAYLTDLSTWVYQLLKWWTLYFHLHHCQNSFLCASHYSFWLHSMRLICDYISERHERILITIQFSEEQFKTAYMQSQHTDTNTLVLQVTKLLLLVYYFSVGWNKGKSQ